MNWDYNLTTFIASILGSFAKLRKSAISFVMPVAPSVRTEQHGSHWTDFHEILYLSFFGANLLEKIKLSLKYDKNNGYFT